MERRMGAKMAHIENSADASVLSFVRENDRDKVFAVLNLSPSTHTVTFENALCHGSYTEVFSNEARVIREDTSLRLKPWRYAVFVAAPKL